MVLWQQPVLEAASTGFRGFVGCIAMQDPSVGVHIETSYRTPCFAYPP